MRQYRGTMARLITEDVLHKLADPEPLWVGVDDDDVHNLVLADDDHMYYVELTIRRKSRNDEEDAP